MTPTATDVDAPEIVVMRGSFGGQMDFSPALQRIPYGTVTGRLTVDAGGDDGAIPLTGVFLLPFVMGGVDDIYFRQ